VGTKYDPEASVWGAPCLPDSLWADHERIRQYAGDHRETWGGVSLTIDSNIVDGEINGLPVDLGLAQPFENYRPARQIHGFQSLPEGEGWVMVDDSLLWRHETGAWEEITPQNARLLSARFLDAASGWAASRDDLTGSLTVWRTADGGSSWASSPVQGVESLPSDIASAELMFLDSKTGWLVVKLQSSSSFSLGALFKTEDGGQSWKALTLPVAGVVLFTDDEHGWVTGGVSGEDVYLTEDGGLTWQRLVDETDQPAEAMSLAALPGQPEGTVTASLSGEGTAWALSQEGRCDGATLTPGEAELPGFRCELRTLLWESRDGGETWAPIELPPN
jgi:photosystem II stability/assembly factor-like uncharacterized protein